ncbi:MAG: restriction endonuclease subunit S [Patescibacteria group bacterium]
MKTKWQTKKFGEVCDFYNGKAHEKVIDANGNYIVVNSKFISSDGEKYKKTKKALFPLIKGDIVMVMSDVPSGKTLAKCFIIDKENTYTLNQRICAIRSKVFETRFLYLQLNRHKYLLSFDNGENQTNLRKDDILNCPLLVPPILEQKHIIKTLDEMFEKIKKAKENTEKNLQNSKALFESYLQDIFTNPGKDLEEKKLGDVCDFVQGIQVDAKLQSEIKKENQIRFLRIIDFTQGDELPRYIDNPGEKYIINSNDISLVRYGASTGFVCKGLNGVLANNLFRVIPKNNKEISNEYLYIFLMSPVFQNSIKASMGGTAMPAISFGLIKDIIIPLMSFSEQKAIVKKLDELSNQTKKLEVIYKQKLADLEDLKKSVLKKAFVGEL